MAGYLPCPLWNLNLSGTCKNPYMHGDEHLVPMALCQ